MRPPFARPFGAALLMSALFLGPALAQPGTREVVLRLDDRQVRTAGIDLARVEAESGASEIALPGQVVVPPTQFLACASGRSMVPH